MKTTAFVHTYRMRKRILCVVILLVSLFLLCACDEVEDMGSLPEFSKPYAGEYTCETLTLGGKDCLPKFEEIKLNLKGDETFILTYKTAGGAKGDYAGEYAVSPEGDEITFTSQAGVRSVSRTFPMEKGAICVEMSVAGKLLYAKFVFP